MFFSAPQLKRDPLGSPSRTCDVIRCCVLVSVAFSVACAAQRAPHLDEDDPTQAVSCANNPSPDTTVFNEDKMSKPPHVVSGPDLRYPAALAVQGQSGRVIYSLIINKDGTPDLQSVKVVRSDDLRFEWAARDWLKEARFAPGCLNGQAVRVRVTLPIDFKVRR